MSESDLELLHRYAKDGCEDAFAEVVQRHVDFVHSAALRQVRSPQLAQDVSQSVFLDLARNIPRLKPDTVVAAWLYEVTRRTAVDALRSEARRAAREQIVHDMREPDAGDATWLEVQPMLDEGLAQLEEAERTAILLRFFQGKTLREVGSAIGLTDDAAQKRVSRALEKLRAILLRGGVTIGTAGLVAMLSSDAVQAAPVGLASAIAGTATGNLAAGGTLFFSTTKAIAMTTLQKTAITLALVGAVGVAIHQHRRSDALEGQLTRLRAELAEAAEARNRAEQAAAESARASQAPRDTNDLALAGSLARIRAEKDKLAQERDAAERLARIYKELAESREESSLTNKYPTRRHLTAGLGKILRRQAAVADALKDRKPEEMTSEEKNLMMATSAEMMTGLAELTQAGLKLDGERDPGAARDPVDEMSVFAYGLLELSEPQFQQAYQVLDEIHREAVSQNLLRDELGEDAQEALKALDARGRAALAQVLTPEQSRIWSSLGGDTGLFGAGGMFRAFSKGSPVDAMLGR